MIIVTIAMDSMYVCIIIIIIIIIVIIILLFHHGENWDQCKIEFSETSTQ